MAIPACFSISPGEGWGAPKTLKGLLKPQGEVRALKEQARLVWLSG